MVLLQVVGDCQPLGRVAGARDRVDHAVFDPHDRVAGIGRAGTLHGGQQVATAAVDLNVLVGHFAGRDGDHQGRAPVHLLAEGFGLVGAHTQGLQADGGQLGRVDTVRRVDGGAGDLQECQAIGGRSGSGLR